METCNSCDENFSRCSELGAQCQENTPYKCGNPTSKLYSVYCNPSVENCRIHNISKPLISSQYHYVYFGCVKMQEEFITRRVKYLSNTKQFQSFRLVLKKQVFTEKIEIVLCFLYWLQTIV